MADFRRVVADRFGKPDVLRLVEGEPMPTPQSGEVRVAIEASGIGFTDTAVRRGKYLAYRGGTPFTPGYDLIGTVDALGPGVTSLAVGDRVADIPVVGGYASHIVRPASQLVRITKALDPAIAACVPLVWMTAWQMLVRIRPIPSGSWILIGSAGGGVGTAMLELARYLGLRTIGTCSPRDFAKVRARGGLPIDDNDSDLVGKVRATAQGGVAAAFDAMGGSSARMAHSCISPGGMFVSYGAQDLLKGTGSIFGTLVDFIHYKLLWNRPAWLGGYGISRFYLITDQRKLYPEQFEEDVRFLCEALADGRLEPPEVQRIGLSGVREAHEQLERHSVPKKFVIDMSLECDLPRVISSSCD
ncbi:MAG: alcohol dehydrogenase catalytic domain-containing protein [Betaproteobacteria bacterium]|nr:alcohol dehydrogenase catalytic domain-containing protein [Betaproteobacteria bacterium]